MKTLAILFIAAFGLCSFSSSNDNDDINQEDVLITVNEDGSVETFDDGTCVITIITNNDTDHAEIHHFDDLC